MRNSPLLRRLRPLPALAAVVLAVVAVSVAGDHAVAAGLIGVAAALLLIGDRGRDETLARRVAALRAVARKLGVDAADPAAAQGRPAEELTALTEAIDAAAATLHAREAALRRGAEEAIAAQKTLEGEVQYRRKLASSLQNTTEFLELAQAAGGFGIFDLDLVNGSIQGSPMFFELIGIKTEDRFLTQEQWLCSIHPEDLEGFVGQFGAAVASGGQYHTEYRSLWPHRPMMLGLRSDALRAPAGAL